MKLIAALALFFPLLAFCDPIPGTAELILSDGMGNSVDILDGSLGDACAAAGCVTFIGAVGGWHINVTTGADAGAAFPAVIHLSSIDTAVANSGILSIEFSDSGFTDQTPGFLFTTSMFSTQGKFRGTYAAYGDAGDQKFALTDQLGSTLTFLGSGTQAEYGANDLGPTYSLTEIATLDFRGNADSASFDAALEAVPEPGSIMLLGTALLGCAFLLRRK